jgi:DNA-binding GntR family transcriptional regulator
MFWTDAPQTLLAKSAWTLRNKIMQGELKPGDRLVEQSLAAMLAISRPSLREVLCILASEGLLEQIPNVGYSVAKLDAATVEQIHEAWALLTGEAVYEFTRRADKTSLARLRRLPAAMRSNADNRLKLLSILNDFFNAISEGCGNRIMSHMVWSLVARINFLRALCLNEAVANQWADDFDALLKAVGEGRASHARALVRKNIAHASELAKIAVSITSNLPPAARRRSSERRDQANRVANHSKAGAQKRKPRIQRAAAQS